MAKPTKKQKEYASQIAEVLGINLPKDNTKEAYSKFISKYEEEALEDVNYIGDELLLEIEEL